MELIGAAFRAVVHARPAISEALLQCLRRGSGKRNEGQDEEAEEKKALLHGDHPFTCSLWEERRFLTTALAMLLLLQLHDPAPDLLWLVPLGVGKEGEEAMSMGRRFSAAAVEASSACRSGRENHPGHTFGLQIETGGG
jgi:hypothetical protein